ncbi:hypothetical protein [Kribbella speibonae]|uniref:tRNA nuclease CdiA C-terminal domain-containing protein n=1 Tax=Kribbella speibonae TaxID=1572660 RepID=A0A4R0I7Y1_9ACTN|nr:hypothetical protein [Kribbella speibonae]TCC29021.1 hypothetical protein E0H92_43370 [Kribbella speibonae]
MPSELQRVARGLIDCFDEIPRVVDQLLRTAARCRENAQVALIASRGQATVAAQQLDAAARACEAAAHFLSMAPPKARGWAEGLVGTAGPSTNRPSSDSADRNKSTSGTGAEIRTRRLTATYEDLEVAEDNEPPLVTVARKAFENYHKTHEKDDDEERDDENLLELEITVTESGEVIFEEPDEKDDEKRTDRLVRDFEIDPDLTEAVKTLLEEMADEDAEKWEHATLTITTHQIELTVADRETPRFQPLVVDIELPELPTVDFDPAFDFRPMGADFTPGVHDPENSFKPKERAIADRLAAEGWRIDARLADHTQDRSKNPDVMVRKAQDVDGVIIEFKTLESGKSNAVKRNIHEATEQAGERGEILIDGRTVGLSEDVALRSFRRALGQPGGRVAGVVHVILGDGRLITYTKEQ